MVASGVFILASITDGLMDIRRRGQIPHGYAAGPLADKLMIAACYITLLRLSPDT